MIFLPRRFSASRRFPQLSWAWPDGDRQQLVIAAAHGDERRAAEAFVGWLSASDLDAAQFAEQRLLVSAANRFPASRLHVPNRARLNGMIRMLWTKSRLSLSNAAPALRALRSGGVELLLLKGSDLPTAFSILDSAGWRADSGESALLLRERGARFRSHNFLKPPYGDIDLHTRAYLTTSRDNNAETMLWTRSTRVELLDIDVLVPSPTDRLMISIAHGGPDAHHHSDWLVDCAKLIEQGEIDWPLVVKLARELVISAQVVQVLFYLREILSIAIPEDVLLLLWQQACSDPAAYFKALMLGHPRGKHSLMSTIGRRVFKMHQSAQVKAANAAAADRAATPKIKLRRLRSSIAFPELPAALRHRIVVKDGAKRCMVVICMGRVECARRYVFEINTSQRHVVRLKFRDRRGGGPLKIGAEISLPEDVDCGDLWIEARQSGTLPSLYGVEEETAFGARPFHVVTSDPLRQDPRHQASPVACQAARAPADESRSDRARQQDRAHGLGDDGQG